MGCVRKVKNGKWKYDFRDDRGRRHVKQGFSTKREADHALRDCLERVDRGKYVSPKRIPTFDQLAAEWLAGKRNHHPATRAGWHVHIEKHLVPCVEPGRRIDRIDTSFVEKHVRDVLCGGNLGTRTINKILTTGAAIFKLAQRRGLVEANPFALAERLHEGGELREDEDRAVDDGRVRPEDVPTTEALRRMLDCVEPGFYLTLFLFAALTGCRSGELRALEWGNLDLAGGMVKIRRAHTHAHVPGEERRREGRVYGPKTKAGVRDIPLQPQLVAALRRWRLQCPRTPKKLVFPGPSGSPFHQSTVLRQGLYPAWDRAELRHFDMKSLRHYFASSLIMGGAAVTEVAHLMGQADANITLRRYAHWFREAKSDAMERLAAAVCGPE